MVDTWIILTGIVIVYVIASMALGVWSRRGLNMDSMVNWSIAGRTTGLIVMWFMMAGAAVSAYTFLGSPGWAYTHGYPALFVVQYLALMAITAYIFGPLAWRYSKDLGAYTLAQVVRLRYESKAAGALMAVLTGLGSLSFVVIQLQGGAYILSFASGGRIPHALGVLIVIAVVGVYVYTSGLRAMGFTNTLQGILMLTVSWTAGILVMYHYTGSLWFGNAFRMIAEARPEMLTIEGGGWGYAFWTTAILVNVVNVTPTNWVIWQGARSPLIVRRMAGILPIFYIVLLPTITIGLLAAVVMPEVPAADQIALEMLAPVVPVIIVGLYIAATLAGAMSSTEPGIHTVSLTLGRDVLQPFTGWSDEKCIWWIRKRLMIVIMALCVPIAIFEPAQIVYILLIGNGFIAQGFAALIGVAVWPRATKYGAVAGFIVGGIVVSLFSFIWPHPYDIHAGIWGLLINLAIFIPVSLLTQPESKKTIESFFPDLVESLYDESKS